MTQPGGSVAALRALAESGVIPPEPILSELLRGGLAARNLMGDPEGYFVTYAGHHLLRTPMVQPE